ncbi:MAG: esterase family protein [Chitinophagaceae bacterium]|nr:esterase family protein [Chitinophagaceae bacterium]
MKKYLLQIVLLLVTTSLLKAQSGKVLDLQTTKSPIMGKAVNYMVYLPPDYATSTRSYPVVYLLHGYTDDHTAWVQFGEINRLADKAIAEGIIPPMIIAMPDADSSFYVNSFDGKINYEDFFFKEFIPTIEKNYRTLAQKRYRGIAGLSMGGYGSMLYALKHPDVFAATAPLSAAFFDDSTIIKMPNAGWNMPLGIAYGTDLEGANRLTKSWYDNSIHELIRTKSANDLRKVRYWIDCGDDDFLMEGNCMVHISLSRKGVPHEFRMRDGGHDWNYWRTGIIDALAFIGKSFRQ